MRGSSLSPRNPLKEERQDVKQNDRLAPCRPPGAEHRNISYISCFKKFFLLPFPSFSAGFGRLRTSESQKNMY